MLLILLDSRRVFLFFDFDLVLELPRLPLSHFRNQIQFVSRLHRQLLDLPSRDGLFDLRNRFPAQRHRFPVLVRLRHDRSIRRVVRDELDRIQDLVAQFRVRRDRVVQHGKADQSRGGFCCVLLFFLCHHRSRRTPDEAPGPTAAFLGGGAATKMTTQRASEHD